MSGKHLLVVSGFWPTRANAVSGIFVVQQVAALVRAGFRVTVVVPATLWRPAGPLVPNADLGLGQDGVTLLRVPVLRFPRILSRFSWVIAANIRMHGAALSSFLHRISETSGYDACIIHDTSYAGLSLPAWRRHVAGNCAIVMHGVDPHLRSETGVQRARPFFVAAARAASAFVLVGSRLKALARELGVPEPAMQVIANGTDLPPEGPHDRPQREFPAPRRVVSVSNLVPLKGIDDNLRALAQVASARPDLSWKYRVVGDGPMRAELETLARQLGIASRVTFLGRLSYAESMSEISDADVFSMPSWAESFGIVYLEAMARKKPVIGCRENGPADFTTHGMDGVLVGPRSVPELAGALAALLEDPARCRAIGESARRTAEKYTWDANAQVILDVLGVDRGHGR